MVEGHLGPEPLEDGVLFSTELADRIFRETGVRANYRARKQWGRGKKLTPSGPADALGRALRLVNRYGREAAREAEGDPPPQIGDPPSPESAHGARRAGRCGRTLFAHARDTRGARQCWLTVGTRKAWACKSGGGASKSWSSAKIIRSSVRDGLRRTTGEARKRGWRSTAPEAVWKPRQEP